MLYCILLYSIIIYYNILQYILLYSIIYYCFFASQCQIQEMWMGSLLRMVLSHCAAMIRTGGWHQYAGQRVVLQIEAANKIFSECTWRFLFDDRNRQVFGCSLFFCIPEVYNLECIRKTIGGLGGIWRNTRKHPDFLA